MAIKTNKKKIISLLISIVSISLLIGSFSYAWLEGSFLSANQVTINAGYLDLTYNASANLINMTNALPQSDTDAITNNDAHTFNLTNNSTENIGYIIKLENICVTSANVDVCVPDQYVKAAISINNGAYTTIALANGNIIASGTITKKVTNPTVELFSLKIWLSSDTPNTYNKGTTATNIVYQGQLKLETTQQLGTLVSGLTIDLGYTTIAIDGQTQATVSVSPADATNKTVTWSSSNPSVATISSSGLIFGIASGTTRICAVANDGSANYDCNNLTVTTN